MSWNIFNALKRGAKPIWLFKIDVAGQSFFHVATGTPFSTPVGSPSAAFTEETLWTPLGLDIGSLRRAHSDSKSGITLKIPRETPVGQAFIYSPIAWKARFQIWQGFANDPDKEFVRMFIGIPTQIKPGFETVNIVMHDQTTTLINKGLTRVAQASCPFELFGEGCRLSDAAWRFDSVVTAVTSGVLTVPGADAYPNGHFNRGRILLSGDEQTILNHVGNFMQLAGPFYALQQATLPVNVTLLPGCRKSLDACAAYGNELNFGGLGPYVLDSPYDGGSVT